ncbi:MAG: hypothetical protein HLX50_02175 [Alteromonadaceae bacterium]|nr:hypothetical protein [Alteromonadaceae bacterium]
MTGVRIQSFALVNNIDSTITPLIAFFSCDDWKKTAREADIAGDAKKASEGLAALEKEVLRSRKEFESKYSDKLQELYQEGAGSPIGS